MARKLVETLILALLALPAPAANFSKVVFGSPSADLADFEGFAARAKQAGATHINIAAEDLPWARWQYDTPGDPYPSWVISNTGLLKIVPPAAIRAHIPAAYSREIMTILEQRCRVLRKLGLKAAFTTFEPQMLPEAVFREHPLWRGARVDHPNRSRVARFAPSIDNREVLALYREATAELVKRCPELEMLSLRTNDSGTGLDWSGGLYSGRIGNTLYRNRAMDTRLRDFFAALQEGARLGGGTLEIDVMWTREREPARIARTLGPGMALENLEGPGATPYKATAGHLLDYENAFYPVIGVPQPVGFLDGLMQTARSKAPRLIVSMGDRFNRDLYFRIYDQFRKSPPAGEIARLTLLRQLAVEEAGSAGAEATLAMWQALREAEQLAGFLNSGGYVFYLGCVQQRWLTRPFVPFPGELESGEKDYYRRFQFQARTEQHAEDLTDLQASHTYSGMAAGRLAGRLLARIERHVETARRSARTLRRDALARRLEAFVYLTRNARNAMQYQAQLDRVRALGVKPEFNPASGTQSGWDRQAMLEIARAEIDNTAAMMMLLKGSPEPVLHLAPTPEEEDIRILGPDLVKQFQKKLDIMNAHWEDYKRLFTTPNL